METKKAAFRLDAATLRKMDRLVKKPPSTLLDEKRGAPRNRTELIEVLVNKAAETAAKEAKD